MRCPICHQPCDSATTTRPFCSSRCRTLDLGRWLDETNTLPHVPDPEDDEIPPEDGAGPPTHAEVWQRGERE